MNCVQIGGNITRDPELKYLQSGTPVCNFTLAVNERRKKGEEWVDETIFIDCAVWGKQGEKFAEFHQKGSKAFVNGRLRQETWDDKDTGKKRSKIAVNVDRWHFAARESGGGGRQAAPQKDYSGDDRYAAAPDDYGPEDTPF